ncbi:MAG: RES domain-containing protein [Sphingobacteriaceae bacterium]|nr:MAG: RES domain-containing protein [Sphingobacteriaceae bacterium]
MEIFKIADERYSKSIGASGTPNRWNKSGQFVAYAASSRSLATLEMMARRSCIMPSKIVYKMMVLSFNDDDSLIRHIKASDLPQDWNKLNAYPKLQEIGSAWYSKQETLILKVPSAIVPREYNFVINTKHPLFSANVNLVRSEAYFWDERLL